VKRLLADRLATPAFCSFGVSVRESHEKTRQVRAKDRIAARTLRWRGGRGIPSPDRVAGELRPATTSDSCGSGPWHYWILPQSLERAQLNINGQEDRTQGKDSGGDLQWNVAFELPPAAFTSC